jgi:hypothetical protein
MRNSPLFDSLPWAWILSAMQVEDRKCTTVKLQDLTKSKGEKVFQVDRIDQAIRASN